MIRPSLLSQVKLEKEGKVNTNVIKVPIFSSASCSIRTVHQDPILQWEFSQEHSNQAASLTEVFQFIPSIKHTTPSPRSPVNNSSLPQTVRDSQTRPLHSASLTQISSHSRNTDISSNLSN